MRLEEYISVCSRCDKGLAVHRGNAEGAICVGCALEIGADDECQRIIKWLRNSTHQDAGPKDVALRIAEALIEGKHHA